MTIQSSAQAIPIVTPNPGLSFTDKSNGNLTNNARLSLQQMRNYIVNMSRTIPCNAAIATNVITLTLLQVQPAVAGYYSYEQFAFVAPSATTGAVTALVVTETGALPTLKVYKNSGAQAGSGDIKANCLYRLIYDDSRNSGAGGFVIDGSVSATVAAPTIVPVSGSGDDVNINANFAALQAAVNSIRAAIGA